VGHVAREWRYFTVTYCQGSKRQEFLTSLAQFCRSTVNEEQCIAHKLLGEKFQVWPSHFGPWNLSGSTVGIASFGAHGPLDFQVCNFSGHLRATQTDIQHGVVSCPVKTSILYSAYSGILIGALRSYCMIELHNIFVSPFNYLSVSYPLPHQILATPLRSTVLICFLAECSKLQEEETLCVSCWVLLLVFCMVNCSFLSTH